jgi:hypothetical protein
MHRSPGINTRGRFLVALILLAELWLANSGGGGARAGSGQSLLFPETGFSVSAPFFEYWQSRGGLFSYGYPIGDETIEGGYAVQYFERARFELHPENAGTPHEVLLGRLGVQLTLNREFAPGEPNPGAAYFAETRHTLRGDFSRHWQDNGGLARFGYPISEEMDEGGHTVQWFERARFELHQENQPPYRVLLGHLGKEIQALRRKASRFVQVMGRKLVTGADLRPLTLKGFNYFPRDFAWTDFDQWPAERVQFELLQAKRLGANTLRVFVHHDAFGGAAEGWGQQEGFARFVKMAKENGFLLIVGLFDELRKAPSPGWDNWPAEGAPEEAEDKAYLKAVVSPWKDESAILAWDLYNEPDYVSEQEWQWREHRANRLNWLTRMARELRAVDPNHAITLGVALASSNTLAAGNDSRVLDMVDFVSVHYYPRNYTGESLETVLSGLKWQTRKPIVVEEAGYATTEKPESEQEQARFISNTMSASARSGASGVLVWTLYDFPRHATNSEGHYGLLRVDDSPKPAADAFSRDY